ncbi:uncharacterized protein BCR38DRAFT_399620 [Pseudomassariella vexata]|uniref:FAD-binding PCMH-type domain-containing protein n=1 Tax=Pseudomassariella vexata TaxID=1141098 RepID=A0A1Y2DJG0_9PEZI|nr:uncharacterized protein BCR38DRAFT_399620 [Pseudomassariella vexata]ORY59306.1 hypothetical protein BCR38DRAFT_399620 [Pseudomassariella vexata]
MLGRDTLGASLAFLGHVVAQSSILNNTYSTDAATNVTSITGIKACDALLNAGLGSILTFPTESKYESSVSTYYAYSNRLLQPYCIVQPRSTREVSTVLKTLKVTSAAGNWDIAVRSGGHSDYDNNAVARGVTIDLGNFNATTLNSTKSYQWAGKSVLTKSIASIRPGARWGSVYSYLEQFGLSVTGGRSSHVGVGGLLVSGGASYHTQLWGLSADNIVNYEVVLADGSIMNANSYQNADLFKALKGGGSNLGIVTRFDMRTYTVPNKVYGGLVVFSFDYWDAIVDQFIKYVSSIGQSGSPDHEFVVLAWPQGGSALATMLMTVSTDGATNSSNFAPLNNLPTSYDVRASQSLSSVAETISDTGGANNVAYTLTLQATREMMQKATTLSQDLIQELTDLGVPVSGNFVFQPLPKMLASINPGRNLFGFDENLPSNQILFEARIGLPAGSESYEGIVAAKLAPVIEILRAYSASLPNHSPYLYMNYANPEQDVIGSYGAANAMILKETAAKYDPTGFFQYRIPGGWKVSRVTI